MKSRIVLLFLLFLTVWLGLMLRGAHLQIFPSERLSQLQKRQFKKLVTLRSHRGAIVDRNGRELAVTVSSHSLFADPSLIKEPRKVARQVGRILKKPWRPIYKKLKMSRRRFVWIQRQVSASVHQRVQALKERGLGFVEEPKRIYPNEGLLAAVLGFVGSEGRGLEGLELQYDQELRGLKKTLRLEKDARGRPLLVDGRLYTQLPEGSELELTIDAELQFYLEKQLSEVLAWEQADSAVGVVLDAKTSEILAMANIPTFDSNVALKVKPRMRKNRVLTDAFEPGSTMKTFVVASGLEKKLIQPNTRFNCEMGRFQIGRRVINDSDVRHRYGWLTVSEILARSSNVGMSKIGLMMGDQKVRQALLDFGFGQKTEVPFPGENRGILNILPWKPHLLANVSFGHGVTTTPLQMAAAYAAIANGGLLKSPLLVKQVRPVGRSEGYQSFESKVIRRVLSEETAAMVRLLLTGATDPSATGFTARVPGFLVAGKTGTAQKVNPHGRGYLKGAYISSFAGFLPAHDPQFVIYVAVDNPKKNYYGSQVAAPIFSKVAQMAVRKAGLAPILLKSKDIMMGQNQKLNVIKKSQRETSLREQRPDNLNLLLLPSLAGLTLREAIQRLKPYNLKVRVKGSGVVAQSTPSEGEKIPRNRRVQLELKSIE